MGSFPETYIVPEVLWVLFSFCFPWKQPGIKLIVARENPRPQLLGTALKSVCLGESWLYYWCKFTPKMCTSFDLSITFNMVSNVLRIPIAVTAFSSLSSPSKSWTNVPAYRWKQNEIKKSRLVINTWRYKPGSPGSNAGHSIIFFH